MSADAPFSPHKKKTDSYCSSNVDCRNVHDGDGVDDYVKLQSGHVPNFSSKGVKFGHINICSLIGKIE